MAYKVRMRMVCQEEGCVSGSRWEVYNRTNGQIGFFCTVHANARIRGLEAFEKAEDKRREDTARLVVPSTGVS